MKDKFQKLQKPELRRTFSMAERDGIERAMQMVRKQITSYKNSGLSPLSFFCGVFNIALSGFILGKFPEYYWIIQLIKCTFFLTVSGYIKYKKKNLFYYLDFCWVFCFYQLGYVFLCFLNIMGIDMGFVTANTTIFCMMWGIINGPLGWSILVLQNSLIFHDIENTASVFIHLSPGILTWTMRWYAKKYNDQWPGVFGMPLPIESNIGFKDIFIPAFTFYGAWWILHLIWLLIQGRYHAEDLPYKDQKRGYDTVYHWAMKGASRAKLCGFDKKYPTQMSPVLKYMIIHCIFITPGIVFSYATFHSYWFHTLWLILLFSSALWNGSIRYYKMMTQYYEKMIQKALKKDV